MGAPRALGRRIHPPREGGEGWGVAVHRIPGKKNVHRIPSAPGVMSHIEALTMSNTPARWAPTPSPPTGARPAASPRSPQFQGFECAHPPSSPSAPSNRPDQMAWPQCGRKGLTGLRCAGPPACLPAARRRGGQPGRWPGARVSCSEGGARLLRHGSRGGGRWMAQRQFRLVASPEWPAAYSGGRLVRDLSRSLTCAYRWKPTASLRAGGWPTGPRRRLALH